MKECKWYSTHYVADDTSWDSECGDSFLFNEEGPANNGFKFCPFCGGSLKEEKPVVTMTRRQAEGEGRREDGWLLERRVNGEIEWVALSYGMWQWTQDSTKALRFARREDADAMAEIIDDAEYVTEHQWGP